MTNLEIAQEQLNKQKEERRIELIKEALVEKENKERRLKEIELEIKEIDKRLVELETKEIILSGYNYSVTFGGTFYNGLTTMAS